MIKLTLFVVAVFTILFMLFYLLARVNDLEGDVVKLRNWHYNDSKRIADLERGAYYIAFRNDDLGDIYLESFGSHGNPIFYTRQSEKALKFNLKRAREIEKQWNVHIRNTMTGELID